MKITFSESQESTKNQKNYAVGKRKVQVVKAEEGKSKSSGTPSLMVEFQTQDNDNFKVKHWFYHTPKALSILLNFLSAVGIYDKNSKEDLDFTCDDLLGAVLEVEFVKDDEDKYLVLKPYSCKAVGGITTSKKDDSILGGDTIPF